jgi:hypothetical protein
MKSIFLCVVLFASFLNAADAQIVTPSQPEPSQKGAFLTRFTRK